MPGGVVTGEPDARATARRMVPAHAAQLARDPRWRVEVMSGRAAVILTVSRSDTAVAGCIAALGFHGLMANQDHHRAHHMAIVRGAPAH